MATLQIISWRAIPAQVLVKKSRREQAKFPLSERFEKAIDMAAMRDKSHNEEDYLEGWVKSEPIIISDDDIETAAKQKAQELEDEYDQERLKALIKNGGHAF